MSDHRVPGRRARLKMRTFNAARQGTVDARGVGPSDRYRLRCVVEPPWRPVAAGWPAGRSLDGDQRDLRDSRATIWATRAGWRGAVRLGAGRFGLRQPLSVRSASSAQRFAWRDDLRENGGARALSAKGENFSFRGCIRRPMEHPPGPTTCTAVRGAPPLQEGCQFPADYKGKEISLLATFNV
jgi:hypothetical protein